MVSYSINLKIVSWFTINDTVTEAQIRGYLANTRPDLEAKITTLVANAPAAAEAVLDGTQFTLKLTEQAPGEWELYPKMVLDVSVADGITLAQILNYLEDYWDQAKTVLRNLVANAPAGANAQITEWHVHRLSGSVDEVEV